MAAPPTYNAAVKCIHQIPGGIFPGKAISFRATTPPGAYRFTVNLQCGPNTDSSEDVAFHFNVRFPDGCVVRNHRTSNTWGPEERDGGLPIRQGVAFQSRFVCDPTSIKVFLNGIQFCVFVHRLPYQRITHITFAGDVTLTSINFEDAQPQPPFGQNLVLPYIRQIPGGMYPSKNIRVKGSTPPGSNRFTINLQCGPNSEPSDDIAFHFNVRFPEGCVVRNHFSLGNWGTEERAGVLPLRRGEPFVAQFLCTRNSFKVTLNGVHFCEFVHRLTIQRITHIRVLGDVILKFIDFF